MVAFARISFADYDDDELPRAPAVELDRALSRSRRPYLEGTPRYMTPEQRPRARRPHGQGQARR